MANKSQIRIEVNGKGFEATYVNSTVKSDNKVIVKAPNGKVVTEKVMDLGNIVEGKKQDKEVVSTELTRKWVDTDGNIYEKKDLTYYNWEGKQISENLKTEVFVGKEAVDLMYALDNYSFESYYKVTPIDVTNAIYSEFYTTMSPDEVFVGDFNLTSKGFTPSFGALRKSKDGNFEIMVFKNTKN